ncbi:MAG: hypothetical protein KJO34_01205 [Deltaproteobacteria bacterium]|nr:hypothetical protein [Deltaproteobacteria bacterium]
MPFAPNPVLGSRIKSAKYGSIQPKGTSYGRLRVETLARLDFKKIQSLRWLLDINPAGEKLR